MADKPTKKGKKPALKQSNVSSYKTSANSKDIEAYQAKRDFSKTPEPAAQKKKAKSRSKQKRFVVHRHEARRLHYDLRLEDDGVLKCWAIPKGFSYNPADKHLAVRTEDHPLRYTEFKGMIPRGEYGGGTMLIHDEGTYDLVKAGSLSEALQQGEVKVKLWGCKLRGEWHLVETQKEKHHWLSFKSKDRYARGMNDFIARVDLSGLEKAPMGSYKPMQAKKGGQPFSKPGWIFENCFAGKRALLYLDADEVKLFDKSHEEIPGLHSIKNAANKLRAGRAVLDGVLVVPDQNGRPDKNLLEQTLKTGGNQHEIIFYTFDLLYYEEWDITGLKLGERKELLLSIVNQTPNLLYVDHVESDGETFARVIAESGLPGLVAKDTSAPYGQKPSNRWLRINVNSRNTTKPLNEALQSVKKKKTIKKFEFKNLDKIYWPAEAITKGDLLAYYQKVADLLLPYLYNRPVHMLRYPDGIEGEFFYQKQTMHYTPDFIETIKVSDREEKKDTRYMMLNDRDSLLYCINLGSIDLHPWMSQKGSLDHPDVAFIDLDPKEAAFSHVLRLARATGKLLRGIGLRPYVKTSGKTGIHICIPLEGGYSYEQSRMFCEGVARVIARENDDIATVERATQSRGKKVYIDFLQNRREQTIVPPYVVRPVPGAQVSAPLDWDEIEQNIEPAMFTIKNMPARIEQMGDVYRGALEDKQNLLPAIEKLQQYIENM